MKSAVTRSEREYAATYSRSSATLLWAIGWAGHCLRLKKAAKAKNKLMTLPKIKVNDSNANQRIGSPPSWWTALTSCETLTAAPRARHTPVKKSARLFDKGFEV